MLGFWVGVIVGVVVLIGGVCNLGVRRVLLMENELGLDIGCLRFEVLLNCRVVFLGVGFGLRFGYLGEGSFVILFGWVGNIGSLLGCIGGNDVDVDVDRLVF